MSARAKNEGNSMYGMPEEIDVKADGALRIITLNRPDALNAVNDNLHVGLAKIWEALNEDTGARAAVITGAGRAFSAGGDFNYLDELFPALLKTLHDPDDAVVRLDLEGLCLSCVLCIICVVLLSLSLNTHSLSLSLTQCSVGSV